MKRGCIVTLAAIVALGLAVSCTTGSSATPGALRGTRDASGKPMPWPDEPARGRDAPALGPGFALDPAGALSRESAEVLEGAASVVGRHAGPGSYTRYLYTDPAVMPFAGGGSYRVVFSWRILETPDRGFEVLFFSSTGAAREHWMPSVTLTGKAGDAGTATLENTLGPYADYQLFWNVVGAGAIAIDSIRVYRLDGGSATLLAEEDAEPKPIALAQAFLPRAWAGEAWGARPALSGGTGPYAWAALGPLPEGISLSAAGELAGTPKAAGTSVVPVRVTDAAGVSCPLALRIEVLPPRADRGPSLAGVAEAGARADGSSYWRYEPSAESFANPLRGIRPELDSARTMPWASLGRRYIEWNLLERVESDDVERIRALTDRLLGDLAARNIKAIPRVYLMWPPDRKYWPLDLAAGDYTSPAFRARLERLVARLGEAWNDDPRIAYIEMGIIGRWGEHHHPGFGGGEGNLPASMEKLVGDAFARAFPDKPVMHRNPRDFTDYRFGLHWDVFGSFDRGWYSNDSTLMRAELNVPLLRDRWKTAPRGGEIDPTFLGEPDWSESSRQDVVRLYADRLISLITDLHWNHLAFLDRIDPADAELAREAGRVERALGYRFTLLAGRLPLVAAPGRTATVELSLRNDGASPLYAHWPLELSILDPATRLPLYRQVAEGVDPGAWMPGETQTLSLSLDIPAGLPAGSYPVAVAILDPSGMAPAVRFANRNYWNGGRSPVGLIGVGRAPASLVLDGFHDLEGDRSLYYLPPRD